MGESHIVVISDLHISAAALDDFDCELERHFVCFLEEDLSCRPYPVELVINGDFLDFVQAPPYAGRGLQSQSEDKAQLCFTQTQSREKLTAIHAAHEPTFRALRHFLAASSDNTLVVLPGNHDPDFFWPGVREDFVDFVCDNVAELAKRICFHLQRAYRPKECKEVWIEHGQQYDPVNSFFVLDRACWSEENPPIFFDGEKNRIYACLGTRFLIDYLNDLDAVYPFVDNVKPFSRFVRIFLVSVTDSNFGPMKAAVAAWRILGYLSGLALSHPKDLLGVTKIEEEGKVNLLARLEEVAQRKDAMFDRINRAYPSDNDLRILLSNPAEQNRIFNWLANHMELLEEPVRNTQEELLGLNRDVDERYLSLSNGFKLNETALLVEAANALLAGDSPDAVKLVVMGHTHEPVIKPGGLNYYNTGSWTRYYRFDGGDNPSSWSILREQSYVNFPFQLNYVDIDVNDPSSAQMICFKSREHD